MPSRLSSTNSVSDGGLTPRPKPRRLLSAEGKRRRNARNRRRQKRKRKGLRGKDSESSDRRTPSTISLSITPSEINQAKQLNAVVKEKQQNMSRDIIDAIDNILKVLDNDKRNDSSPTAVVTTGLEDRDNVQASEQGSNVDLHTTAQFRIPPADIAEPLWSSGVQMSRKSSDVLQSEEEPFEKKLRDGQNVPERVSNDMAKIVDAGQEPNSSRAGSALGLPLLALSDKNKSNTTTSKRRRVDVDYTFAESQTAPVPNLSLLQDSHPSKRGSKELLSEGRQSFDVDAGHHIGTVVKSKLLDEILDLEKGVEFGLPEMDQSNKTADGEHKVSIDLYPVQVDGEFDEKLTKDASGHEAAQGIAKNVVDEAKSSKRGVKHARHPQEDESLTRIKNSAVHDVSKIVVEGTTRSGEELGKELEYTSNLFEKSPKPPTTNERGKENGTGKRMRGTSSVSAALRFARKQKMLQGGREVKPKALEQDVPTQEPLCLSPKPAKRKKKKRKTSQPLGVRQMINERQYNESVFVGFRNEAKDNGVQAESYRNVDFMLPPPSLLEDTVDMRNPCLLTSTTKDNSAENVHYDVAHRRGDDDGDFVNEDHGSNKKGIKPGANDSLPKGVDENDYERSTLYETPPPVTEEETPLQYDENGTSGLEVPEERQPKDKHGEQGDRLQDLSVKEGKTTPMGNNASGEDLLADIQPEIPAVEYEKNESSRREPPQHSRTKDQLSFRSRSEDKSVELDFEGKREFFDDMVALMIDTTVELEFFFKDLCRVKGKIRDESPP